MKVCMKCNNELPLSEFYAHPRMADGHLNKCKTCAKKDVHKLRHESDSRQKILAYDRERGNRQNKEYQDEYKKKFPSAHKAHGIVQRAIRSGNLFAMPCSVCNGTDNIHAHHDDYSKPLNVRWLCAEHHRQWHAENGPGLNP